MQVGLFASKHGMLLLRVGAECQPRLVLSRSRDAAAQTGLDCRGLLLSSVMITNSSVRSLDTCGHSCIMPAVDSPGAGYVCTATCNSAMSARGSPHYAWGQYLEATGARV